MFVPKFLMLVAAVAVAVNALPSPQDDPENQYGPSIHQQTEEEQRAEEAAFLALPFKERLAVHSQHKIYRPMGTVKCVRECIEEASSSYPIHAATYGEVCRDRESEGEFIVWARDQVHPCIREKRTEEDTDDLAEDNTPCSSAFNLFEERVSNMCAYLQQDFSDIKPDDTWM